MISESAPFITFVSDILAWQGDTTSSFFNKSSILNYRRLTSPRTFLKLENYGYLKKLHLFISLLFISNALWHIELANRTPYYLPNYFLNIFGFWPKDNGRAGAMS